VQEGFTVAEIALRFWEYAKGYYRKNGEPTSELGEYRLTIRQRRESYGSTPAAEFGPVKFKKVRQAMIEGGAFPGCH
jgi:hypothetical protein